MSVASKVRRSFRQESRFYPPARLAAPVFVPWLFNSATKAEEPAASPTTFAAVREFVTLFNSMMKASPWRASIRRSVEGGAA